MLNLPKVRWVPLVFDKHRILQVIGILYYFTLTLQGVVLTSLISLNILLWPLLLIYFIYIGIDKTPERGGRPWLWYQNLPVWKWATAYFPLNIHTESDLNTDKNYIIACHPHGIISTGVVLGFVTQGVGINNLFPGIKFRIATINFNFVVPFFREIALSLGSILATRKGITSALKRGTGNAVVIVVGGSDEALLAEPGQARILLNKRFGFISLAIKQGVNLVPCYCFGENNCFDTFVPRPGSKFYKLQKLITKHTGFSLPMYSGRTPITYNYGHLPYRTPLDIVSKSIILFHTSMLLCKLELISYLLLVGKPIEIQQDSSPSHEKIQSIHRQYVDALQDLYDRHKHTYMRGKVPDLEIN